MCDGTPIKDVDDPDCLFFIDLLIQVVCFSLSCVSGCLFSIHLLFIKVLTSFLYTYYLLLRGMRVEESPPLPFPFPLPSSVFSSDVHKPTSKYAYTQGGHFKG